VLELDEIRHTLTPRPTYTAAERDVVYGALAYMATLLVEIGMPVIVDATAHRRVWRDRARAAISPFLEVQLLCPPELCRERERSRAPGHAPRGIYARAGRPGSTVPGADVDYEFSLAPELVVDTSRETVAEGAERIAALALTLPLAPIVETPPPSSGMAVWITGRPGSGKTTLALRVAEEIAASSGVPVKILTPEALCRYAAEVPVSEAQQEIVHRALAYAAKLLIELGVAVIVDATAARRAWRDVAREIVPRFAEIQLVCPAEVCMERERITRWRRAAGEGRGTAPDIALHYEESLRPDLVLDTSVHHQWAAAEEILLLVRRLHRAARPLRGPEPDRAVAPDPTASD